MIAGLADLADVFGRGAATPEAVLETCLEAVAARNGALNAIVHLDTEGSRRAASRAAARWKAGEPLSPIDGAPIVVKANVAVEALPWTAALGPFADRVAAEDSAVVARLRAAGAVIVGIANMHEGALGATTTSPLYGQADNPLAPRLTPGGSSGGSAAAVAADFCVGAVGTDTMGSVRLPSAYCGVAGFKPSFGRLSRRGVELLSFSLDHVGVHARTARDLAPLYDAVAGYDAADPFAVDHGAGPAPAALSSLRIGRLVADDVPLEPEVATRFQDALARIGEIATISLTDVALPTVRRRALLVTEAECAALLDGAAALDDPRFSPTFRALVQYGAAQPAAQLAAAHHLLASTRHAVRRAFERVDILLCPTTPHVAFPYAQAAPATQADLTVLANVAGLPAASIPMGPGRDGLPTGLQIIGPRGADARVLAAAQAIEALDSGWRA